MKLQLTSLNNYDRISYGRNNIDLFDFKLTLDEIAKINDLNENLRCGPDPDEFNL